MNPTNKAPTPSNHQEAGQPFKSLAVVTLAGFAGSLAGLSISRSRPILTKNLPYVWAISCATFAGIIECSKIISPTEFLIELFKERWLSVLKSGDMQSSTSEEKDRNNFVSTSYLDIIPMKWNESYTKTLGDYALGGLIAGSIFRGGFISPPLQNVEEQKNTTSGKNDISSSSAIEKQKRVIGKGKVLTLGNNNVAFGSHATREIQRDTMRVIQQTHLPNRAGILAGLVPGLMLGILAGSTQIFIQEAERIIEEQSHDDADSTVASVTLTKEEEDEIERRVKNMSLSDIEKEVALLKKQLGK